MAHQFQGKIAKLNRKLHSLFGMDHREVVSCHFEQNEKRLIVIVEISQEEWESTADGETSATAEALTSIVEDLKREFRGTVNDTMITILAPAEVSETVNAGEALEIKGEPVSVEVIRAVTIYERPPMMVM